MMLTRFQNQALILVIVWILMISLIAVVPTLAQDNSELGGSFVVLIEEVSFSRNDEVLVGDYLVVPAGAIIPDSLKEDNIVTITGYLNLDDETILAFSFGDVVNNANSEDALDTSRSIYCDEETIFYHPASIMLSGEFDTNYEDVMFYFCEGGRGFGEIMLTLILAEHINEDIDTFLELYDTGLGWDQIAGAFDVEACDIFAGRVIGPDWADSDECNGGGQGQGNNRGQGQGNQGQGQGNKGQGQGNK